MENKRGRRGRGHSTKKSFRPNPNAFLNSGGHDDRPNGLRTSHPVKPKVITSSTTAALESAGLFFDGSFIGETVDTHLIPRKSLTDQQMLRLFPQKAEYEDVTCRQLDKQSGELVLTTNRRRVWRSDKTLLRRNNPFSEEVSYKREGAIREGMHTRRYTETVPENKIVDEVIGIADPTAEVEVPEGLFRK